MRRLISGTESWLLALSLLSLVCCGWGQGIQCTRPFVRPAPDGTLDFEELPAGADPVQPEYDPGPIGGWYSLAGGFVDAARPGSLPYDRIRTTLNGFGIQCQVGTMDECPGSDEGGFDIQGTLSSFATWWVGLIIVTIIGGLLAISFCICGCCFCCCRCCGKCGGAKTQQFSENMDCKAFTFTIILLLFLLVLFAAVVLAFFSNQQTFDSVGNSQTTINSVVDNAVRYVNDTVDELEQIVCQLASEGGVAGLVLDEAVGFNDSLQNFASDLESEVETIYTAINRLSPSYDLVVSNLGNLTATTNALVNSGVMLDNSLTSITDSLTMIAGSSACVTLNTLCQDRLPPPNTFQAGFDSSQSGVVVTFIFGFVLLILCAIFFFFGANAQKLCQSIESPQYPLFTEIVDNNTFWGGSLIGQFLPAQDNGSTPEIYISGVLNLCEADTGLFTAANLSFLVPGGNLTELITNTIDFDEVRRTIDAALSNATNDFVFNSTSFLPESVQNSLDQVRNSSVDQINITAFRAQIDAGVVAFDLNQQVASLMNISTELGMVTGPGEAEAMNLQSMVDDLIMQLENLNSTLIPTIQGQLDQLALEVNMLTQQVDTTVAETVGLVNDIEATILNITGQTLPDFLQRTVGGALDRTFAYLDASISHVDTQLTNNIGRCQPLWGIYVQLYNTACRDFLEGLNGFWWSLGLCAVLFIPVIIFSVLASNYYLKKKSENEVEGGYSSYEDYPMKSY